MKTVIVSLMFAAISINAQAEKIEIGADLGSNGVWRAKAGDLGEGAGYFKIGMQKLVPKVGMEFEQFDLKEIRIQKIIVDTEKNLLTYQLLPVYKDLPASDTHAAVKAPEAVEKRFIFLTDKQMEVYASDNKYYGERWGKDWAPIDLEHLPPKMRVQYMSDELARVNAMAPNAANLAKLKSKKNMLPFYEASIRESEIRLNSLEYNLGRVELLVYPSEVANYKAELKKLITEKKGELAALKAERGTYFAKNFGNKAKGKLGKAKYGVAAAAVAVGAAVVGHSSEASAEEFKAPEAQNKDGAAEKRSDVEIGTLDAN